MEMPASSKKQISQKATAKKATTKSAPLNKPPAKNPARPAKPAPPSHSRKQAAEVGPPALTRAAKATASELDLARMLSEAVAVSGDEGAVRKIVLEHIAGFADEVHVDVMGNVHALRKARGNGGKLKVMAAAHMDEVGFMVVGVASDGTLIIEPVGTVDERQFLGKAVWIGAGKVPGVIGAKPVHLMDSSERKGVVKFDSLRVDIGAASADAAKAKVNIGDRGTFAAAFAHLGPAIRGKALDDRLGCATLMELVRGERLAVDLHAVFTV